MSNAARLHARPGFLLSGVRCLTIAALTALHLATLCLAPAEAGAQKEDRANPAAEIAEQEGATPADETEAAGELDALDDSFEASEDASALAADLLAESAAVRPVGVRESGLAKVLSARSQIETDLRERQEALGSPAARGREAEIGAEIRALAEELSTLDRNFSELAAGVDPVSIDDEQERQELNLTNEVRDLLGPLVNELKRATSRPREIDRLRTEIGELGDRLDEVDGALRRLEKTRDQLVSQELIDALAGEKRSWERRRSAISASLQVAQQKLDQRLGESQSIADAIENLFQIFFKSRGRNLLLALVAMAGFLFGIRRLRTFLAARPVLSRRAESFEGRVFGLIYSVFSVLGAVLVFLISLYFFGDWVLLILVLLLILGLIWTSKQAIPRFWSQTVLILDMGSVREGERVIYNGLPWRVDSISFYSQLSNPALSGGSLRLPIDDLSDLRSRAYQSDEPWFPTRIGDVVLLEDGRPAEVELQSIDAVRVRTQGENRLVIPSTEFAGQSLEKLSSGYRVDITFGLDYGDQAQITTTMRDTLERGLESRWRSGRWAASFISLSVEFQTAGASSLDYFVRVDMDGIHAMDLQAQRRALARDCVDICNENGWVIPFTQLTLHMAPPTTES